MDIVQLNLGQSANADRIREPAFDTVKRGYDPSQVLEYLSRVADRVEALEDQVEQLSSELAEMREERDEALESDPSAGVDAYETVSARMTEMMMTLEKEAERLGAEAEAESERILLESKREAHRTRVQAKAAAERKLKEAQKEADRLTSGLAATRESMQAALQALSRRFLDVVTELELSELDSTEDGMGSDMPDTHANTAKSDTVRHPAALPDATQ